MSQPAASNWTNQTLARQGRCARLPASNNMDELRRTKLVLLRTKNNVE